jgi:hypothetical protein
VKGSRQRDVDIRSGTGRRWFGLFSDPVIFSAIAIARKANGSTLPHLSSLVHAFLVCFYCSLLRLAENLRN